jgi:hypothetical protein
MMEDLEEQVLEKLAHVLPQLPVHLSSCRKILVEPVRLSWPPQEPILPIPPLDARKGVLPKD